MGDVMESILKVGAVIGLLGACAAMLLKMQKNGEGDMKPVTAVPAIILECRSRYSGATESVDLETICLLMDGSRITFEIRDDGFSNARAQVGQPGLLVYRGTRYHHFRSGACSEEEARALMERYEKLK